MHIERMIRYINVKLWPNMTLLGNIYHQTFLLKHTYHNSSRKKDKIVNMIFATGKGFLSFSQVKLSSLNVYKICSKQREFIYQIRKISSQKYVFKSAFSLTVKYFMITGPWHSSEYTASVWATTVSLHRNSTF